MWAAQALGRVYIPLEMNFFHIIHMEIYYTYGFFSGVLLYTMFIFKEFLNLVDSRRLCRPHEALLLFLKTWLHWGR